MTRPSHIFIVGSVRSGSSLLRRVLNRSPEVAICGETHYLRHWVGFRGYQHEFAKLADIRSEDGARRVVDHIYALEADAWRGRAFWGWPQKHVPRERFLEELLAADPSNDHAILDVLMKFYAGDKPVRGEKTPAHVLSVPKLLEWYPQAKVVHTLRDPRAILVSEKKRKYLEYVPIYYRVLRKSEFVLELFLSVYVLATWLRLYELHQRYAKAYPDRYRMIRFEDLLEDPAREVRDLCDFLGIRYLSAMLDGTFQNSSFVARNRAKGIDSGAAERWRRYARPTTNRWIAFWARRHLLEFGYPVE